jgi:hypothetical protein
VTTSLSLSLSLSIPNFLSTCFSILQFPSKIYGKFPYFLYNYPKPTKTLIFSLSFRYFLRVYQINQPSTHNYSCFIFLFFFVNCLIYLWVFHFSLAY